MVFEIKTSGDSQEELNEAIKSLNEIIDMKMFTLIASGVIKSNSQINQLSSPVVEVLSKSPEEVSFSITRTDQRGEILLWEIGKKPNLSGSVIGVSSQSGTISESGVVSIESNGNPIESFYLRATDIASTYINGVSEIVFVSIYDSTSLLNPSPIVTPLNNSLKIEFTEDENAGSYLIEINDGSGFEVEEDNASTPYLVTGLTNGQSYQIRVTAVSDSPNYTSSSSVVSGTPQASPKLSTPTGIVFSDAGGGILNLSIASSDPGVTYVVERNGVVVYTGINPVVTGNNIDTTYTFQVKTQKSGFSDSDWYAELYTYQSSAGEVIEFYGGADFYFPFFGKLTYTPLGNGTSRVTYQGSENVFNSSFVGKWLEPSRIHHNSIDYPSSGRNYFPNIIGVVYSKVLSVTDGKNLIVDFEYNGKNRTSPQAIQNEDGTFFFDNKAAIEAWGKNSNRKSLIGQPGRVYAVLGCPKITCDPNSDYRLTTDPVNPAAIHLMASDAFSIDEDATAIDLCPSYITTFGSNDTLFNLPGSGETNIDLQWQVVGPTYTPPAVQYGPVGYRIFVDKNGTSTNHGLKRVISKNPYLIRDRMNSALGSVRSGANYVMPSQGGCNSGGLNNGIDISEFQVYRFEGNWITRNTADFKGRMSGGVLLEWDGTDTDGRFIDMDELAITEVSTSCKWNDNRSIQLNSNSFTWYQASGQYWTGGLSTVQYPNDKLVIDGCDVWFGNNGDWWLLGQSVDISPNIVKSFNRILAVGDVIQNSATDSLNGLIKKLSNNEFVVWGWAVQKGDVLTYAATDYTINEVTRISYTWNQYKSSLPNTDRFINAFKITLNKPIADPLASVVFTVKTTKLGHLIGGSYADCQYKYDAIPFTNLLYIDSNLNTRFTNVNIYGNIRSSSPVIPNDAPLYNLVSIAEWTNVSLIRRDGSPSYSTRNEYQPYSLRIRQLLTGNNTYRFKVSGGRLGLIRDTLQTPEYEFSNRPHLVRNAVQGERVIIINPIISDNLGVIMGTDNEEFSRVQLGLSRGASIDISNSEMKNNLEIFGDGTVDISGISTNLRAGSSNRYYSIEVWDNFSQVKNIGITGDNGSIGIAVLRPLAIGEINIELTDWTLLPGLNNPTGYTTFQNTSDPDYCDFISINGACITN